MAGELVSNFRYGDKVIGEPLLYNGVPRVSHKEVKLYSRKTYEALAEGEGDTQPSS